MKRVFTVCFILVLCLPLCACGQTGKSSGPIPSKTDEPSVTGGPSESPAASKTPQTVGSGRTETSETPEVLSFPFEDSERRTRYRLVINGTEVQTKNYPFTLPEKPKGGYYPIEDVLNCFGVACLTNHDHSAVATVINDHIIKVFAGAPGMTYGKKKISALNNDSIPIVIDGALYVPSFFLMQLTDNSIVDFSGDRTAATLNTDIVVDVSTSGPAGIDKSVLVKESSGGSGKIRAGANRCPTCHGVGGHNEQFSDRYMIPGSGTWMPVSKNRWVSCRVCGGTGVVK